MGKLVPGPKHVVRNRFPTNRDSPFHSLTICIQKLGPSIFQNALLQSWCCNPRLRKCVVALARAYELVLNVNRDSRREW